VTSSGRSAAVVEQANELPPFDADDYRTHVLAAVEKRGGPDASAPIELYAT
jgi:hypothetical protein